VAAAFNHDQAKANASEALERPLPQELIRHHHRAISSASHSA